MIRKYGISYKSARAKVGYPFEMDREFASEAQALSWCARVGGEIATLKSFSGGFMTMEICAPPHNGEQAWASLRIANIPGTSSYMWADGLGQIRVPARKGRRDVLAYAMPGWSAASYTLIGKHADKAAWGKLAEMDEEQADMAAHWIKERGPRMLKTLVSMAPQIREDEEELAVVAKAVASCHQLFWLDTNLVVDALAELGVQAVGSGHEDGRSS